MNYAEGGVSDITGDKVIKLVQAKKLIVIM